MKKALLTLALTLLSVAGFTHGQQVAYCVLSNGYIRVYIEHWHGDFPSAASIAGNSINVTTTYGNVTVTQNVDPSGIVNNTDVNNLPGCNSAITVASACAASTTNCLDPGANNCDDWGYWDFAPAACNVPVTITINGGNTVVFTEACDNLYPATITATFNDNAAPILACPQNITVSNDPGLCGKLVTYAEPTATDACQFCPSGTTIAGYTYLGSYQGHKYFRSNTAGSWTSQHTAAQALGGHLATITSAGENAFLGTATGGAQAWIGLTDQASEGTFVWVTGEPLGYTAWCGGEPNNCCLAQGEDYGVLNWCGAGSWNDLGDGGFYDGSSKDRPGIVEFECIAPVRVSGNASGTFFPVGTTTVTYSATDNANNTSTCSFTVTVNDDEAPMISCPANAQVDCAASTAPSATGTATASDNCPGVTVNHSDAMAPGNCPGSYTITRSWTATDAHNNSSSCTQTITVQDNSGPVISCPPAATIACDAADRTPETTGSGSATATDDCSGVASVTYTDGPDQAGSCPGHASFDRTWTATDACGNSSTCTQTINVVDNIGPMAVCNNATVTLQNGSASVTPGQIGAGSTDNCSGIASATLSKSSFSCADIGANPVTLTLTDGCGNTSACTAVVTVVGAIPSCTITSTPTAGTYTDGNPNHIYLGYGNGRTMLTATGNGGSSFSFNWSPAAGLSCTNCANPVFTPTAGGTYTFTATVTNEFGCSSTCSITVCVLDIRVPGQPNKVYICHVPQGNSNNPQTLSVSVNAVPTHLNGHAGDKLGACTQVCGAGARMISGSHAVVGEDIKVYPNPTNGTFTVELPYLEEHAQISVTDMTGKVIESRIVKDGEGNKQVFKLGGVAKGVYFVSVAVGEDHFRMKLTVQ